MTNQIMKQKLKHIAGLCYGLCLDISDNDTVINELQQKVDELENEKAFVKKRSLSKRTAEQQEKHRQAMREYHANKRAEKLANGEIEPPKPRLTPQEVKERNKIAVKKYQDKKRAGKEGFNNGN